MTAEPTRPAVPSILVPDLMEAACELWRCGVALGRATGALFRAVWLLILVESREWWSQAVLTELHLALATVQSFGFGLIWSLLI